MVPVDEDDDLLVMFVESVVSVVTESKPGFVVLLVSKELVLVEARFVVESDVDLLEVFPVNFKISVRRYIGQMLKLITVNAVKIEG